ncbi:hypothetical protein GGF32_007831 [Allomyces javanicus]|nr:hypothetical protein GGF32_007831 [Allomyces javanicus]
MYEREFVALWAQYDIDMEQYQSTYTTKQQAARDWKMLSKRPTTLLRFNAGPLAHKTAKKEEGSQRLRNSFQIFMKEVRSSLPAEVQKDMTKVVEHAGEKLRVMSDKEKAVYQQRANKGKDAYLIRRALGNKDSK